MELHVMIDQVEFNQPIALSERFIEDVVLTKENAKKIFNYFKKIVAEQLRANRKKNYRPQSRTQYLKDGARGKINYPSGAYLNSIRMNYIKFPSSGEVEFSIIIGGESHNQEGPKNVIYNATIDSSVKEVFLLKKQKPLPQRSGQRLGRSDPRELKDALMEGKQIRNQPVNTKEAWRQTYLECVIPLLQSNLRVATEKNPAWMAAKTGKTTIVRARNEKGQYVKMDLTRN